MNKDYTPKLDWTEFNKGIEKLQKTKERISNVRWDNGGAKSQETNLENKNDIMDLKELSQGMEFKFRVGPKAGDKYKRVLGYIDARDAQDKLDEVVGPGNWQVRFEEHKGNLFASVGIKVGDEWVWKSDCGTESNQDAEKGEASDSFKRACVMWGLGRFLYTLPTLMITNEEEKQNKYEITKFVKEKFKSKLINWSKDNFITKKNNNEG